MRKKLINKFGLFAANAHSETTVSVVAMIIAYHNAKHIFKEHLNFNGENVLILSGIGMTGVVNKFQLIIGLLVFENLNKFTDILDPVKRWFLSLIWSNILITHLGCRC